MNERKKILLLLIRMKKKTKRNMISNSRIVERMTNQPSLYSIGPRSLLLK